MHNKRDNMSYSSRFHVLTVALMVLATSVFAAKSTSGKVRSVIGDVTTQKKSEGNWVPLRVGAKVKEKDVIRTLVESQAVVALPDGSTISVEENSLVEFSQLVSEDGVQTAMTDIKSGKIRFDVQKQASKESSFKFKTGTATAAIRGTAGAFGTTSKGLPIASLRNGKLQISASGKVQDIKGGETLVSDGKTFLVLELSSSGDVDFLNEIDKMLSDPNMDMAQLESKILALDSVYKKNQDAARDSIKCSFQDLPETIYTPSVTIKGSCPAGVSVEVSGERIESTGEPLQFTPSWASANIGEKKFPITCYAGKVSFDCGFLTTNYEQAPDSTKDSVSVPTAIPFQVTTKEPITVCETASATVEGQFDPKDSTATLFVKVGNYTSPNLVPLSAEGKWTHTIPISDRKGNWDEKVVTVEFNGTTGRTKVDLELIVNKECKEVNLKRPSLIFQGSDSLRCNANISLAGVQSDVVILSTEIDGTPVKETYYDSDAFSSVKLNPGIHTYKFTAQDQAGNKVVLQRDLGCYPKNPITINLAKGPKERLRIPPPPYGVSGVFSKTMHFSITGVPNQNPDHVKRVVIKQGHTVLDHYEGSQRIKELDFDVQVNLEYGKTTVIDIIVIMKNGKQINAQKTYEVR